MNLFTISELLSYAKNKLGEQHITVEVNNTDCDDIVDSMIIIYNQYRPKIRDFNQVYHINVQEYKLPKSQYGRGVFNVLFPRLNSIPHIFPTSYTPLSIGSVDNLRMNEVVLFNSILNTSAKITGDDMSWEFDRDSGVLLLTASPRSNGTCRVSTMHDRYIMSVNLGIGNGTQKDYTGFLQDKYYNNLSNILPETFYFKTTTKEGEEVFTDNGTSISQNPVGTLSSNRGGTGTINYHTGEYNISFHTPAVIGIPVVFNINELRSSDKNWCKEYCYALMCIFVANKRKRFTNIPGSQININLDTGKEESGEALKTKLEDDAKKWMWEWLVPRME